MKLEKFIAKPLDLVKFPDAYRSMRKTLTEPQVSILMYHRVSPDEKSWLYDSINPKQFEKQIKYLKKHYEIISLSKLISLLEKNDLSNLKSNTAVITFDDGYKDNYTFAYPVLKKHDVHASVFLSTGYINQRKLFWWDELNYIIKKTNEKTLKIDKLGNFSMNNKEERNKTINKILGKLKRMNKDERRIILEKINDKLNVNIPKETVENIVLNWEEIKEMFNNNIEFGSHGLSHTPLSNLTKKQVQNELEDSKKMIENKLDNEIDLFSYPHGTMEDINDQIVEVVRDSGYKCGLTSVPGFIFNKSNLYLLNRLRPGRNIQELKIMLSGIYPDIARIYHYFQG